MKTLPEEKLLYRDIQKKLYYIIPEKWDCIYLYASVIDVPNQKSVGEMYFYYLPKSIIKKKYVNGYEIPSIFNIDEEQYSKLINDVYTSIKLLHERFVNTDRKVWSNINIVIKNNEFKIIFDYDDLNENPFNSYERHIIWRYQVLKEEFNAFKHKDKKIIENFLEYNKYNVKPKQDEYTEPVYKQPVKNIIEYEKTLSVEEAIAQSNNNSKNVKAPNRKSFLKFNKKDEKENIVEPEKTYTNQILNVKINKKENDE